MLVVQIMGVVINIDAGIFFGLHTVEVGEYKLDTHNNETGPKTI